MSKEYQQRAFGIIEQGEIHSSWNDRGVHTEQVVFKLGTEILIGICLEGK